MGWNLSLTFSFTHKIHICEIFNYIALVTELERSTQRYEMKKIEP